MWQRTLSGLLLLCCVSCGGCHCSEGPDKMQGAMVSPLQVGYGWVIMPGVSKQYLNEVIATNGLRPFADWPEYGCTGYPGVDPRDFPVDKYMLDLFKVDHKLLGEDSAFFFYDEKMKVLIVVWHSG